jgi:hypothetical protein
MAYPPSLEEGSADRASGAVADSDQRLIDQRLIDVLAWRFTGHVVASRV